MSKAIFQIFFWLSFLGLLPAFSLACSPFKEPKSKFDRDLYVFIGEVIGYTDQIKSKNVSTGAYGMKIKVVENVYLPEGSNEFFEVFPLDISADCRRYLGDEILRLQNYYPINSKVRIIADRAWRLPDKNNAGQLRLEVHYPQMIYRNDLNNQFSTTAGSIFNYAEWKDFYYDFFEFEFLKDLKRLEESSSDEEKIKILERLAYLPKRFVDFEAAVQNYIKNPETRQILINKRKALKQNK